MYMDWVIALSLIIVVLICVFLGYGCVYAFRKIHEADVQNEPRFAKRSNG
jgi:uncharacterized protein YneF (UPF0154 family)